MDFSYQERNTLSDIIEKTSYSLLNAMKYIYVISEHDFYNINAKDIFKIALSDIANPEILWNMGLEVSDEQLGEMASQEFKRVRSMIHYAFTIRLPFLKKMIENCPLKEHQMRELQTIAAKRGADNFAGIIDGDMRTMMKLVKNRQPEPQFDGEWFRRWVYTYGKELAAINNRNMFLFGCIDAMFPLFYSALMEKLSTTILKWQGYSK